MKEMKMKWIRQRLDWISRKIIILSKIIIGFGKYLWKLFKKIMKVIWKGGLKMKALIFWLLCLTGLSTGLVIGTIFFGWIFLVVTFGALVFLVILIYFVLAKKNLFFTFIEEGTAKTVIRGATFKKVTTPEGKVYKVTKGGQFRRTLIQWRGYTLDDKEKRNVVPEEKWLKNGKVLKVKEVLEEKDGKLKKDGKVKIIVEKEEVIEGAEFFEFLEPKKWVKNGKALKVKEVLDRKKGKLIIIVEDTEVIEGAEFFKKTKPQLFGGLRLYGFWPFDQIYTYLFQWTGVTENGEIQRHPKEKLDYILLKDDVYWAMVENAEDKELLPLNLEVILTLRVVNPRKALFAVQNWLETIINRTKPAARDSVTSQPYKILIQKTGAIGKEIYKKLEEELLEEEFLDRYGIDVRKIEVKEINPREEYREATLKKWLGQREAEARATATGGALINTITEETGMLREDVQKELKENPKEFVKKYEKIWEKNWDIIYRRMAIDGKAFLDIRTANPIQDLIALLKRMPMGGKEKEGKKKKVKMKKVRVAGIEVEVPEGEEEEEEET